MNLTERSAWLRRELLEMVAPHGKGHLASAFSSIEIFVALYYGGILKFPVAPCRWPADRVIVSKGHATLGLYPILADLGYFPAEELKRYTKPDGLLGIYADMSIPGIPCTSGSLGHGLGIAAGFALADKSRGFYPVNRTYVVLGDGELYEGSCWEAAAFIAHHRLRNVVAIVDRNELCILGKTEELLELDDIAEKWRSFGWDTATVDGHDPYEVSAALKLNVIDSIADQPQVIIANTVKGKGISFMEGRPEWHGGVPSGEQLEQARGELR